MDGDEAAIGWRRERNRGERLNRRHFGLSPLWCGPRSEQTQCVAGSQGKTSASPRPGAGRNAQLSRSSGQSCLRAQKT
eukprot:scaffold1679_cov127-Isochrysis_galbana.AAC.4